MLNRYADPAAEIWGKRKGNLGQNRNRGRRRTELNQNFSFQPGNYSFCAHAVKFDKKLVGLLLNGQIASLSESQQPNTSKAGED